MSAEIFRLDGRVVMLTGASSGFGHHFAAVLANAGAKVVLAARRLDALEVRAQQIRAAGGEAAAVTLDVRDRATMTGAFDFAERTFGPVDVLINNAGMEPGVQTFLTLDEADWDVVLDTNLKGLWLMSQEMVRRVAAHRLPGGCIVNIGSILGERQYKGVFPYAVSKAGVEQVTKLMALEAGRYNVRVNALAPGFFYTAVSARLLDSDLADDFKKGIPTRRTGEFHELDGPLLLLASDASSYMNGSIVVVDGGHSCRTL